MILEKEFTIESVFEKRIDNFKNKICPNCEKPVSVNSTRLKWSCDFCKSDLFVWYGNKIRKNYLLNENEYKQIEVENKKNALIDNILYYLDRVGIEKDEYEQLYNECNHENITLGFIDVLWKLLNKYLIQYISEKQYGLYRNVKHLQSLILYREKKYKQSIEALFEVIYYDINGCSNGFPSFNPENSYISNTLLDEIKQTYRDGKIKKEYLMNLFYISTENINLPISAVDAWVILAKKLRISA